MCALQVARPELDFTLCSPDPEALAHDYADVFGARPLDASACPGPAATGVGLGGHDLFFVQASPDAQRLSSHVYAAIGLRVLAVLVDDLDAVCAKLASLGRRTAPTRGLPGRLRVTFAKDLDGNVLELIGLAEPEGEALKTRLQVGLTVADVEASRAFYGGTLGLPEQRPAPIEKGITRYAFTAGGTTIKFWSTGKPLPSPPAPLTAAIGIRSLRIPVEAPIDPALAAQDGVLLDPDGVIVELVSP